MLNETKATGAPKNPISIKSGAAVNEITHAGFPYFFLNNAMCHELPTGLDWVAWILFPMGPDKVLDMNENGEQLQFPGDFPSNRTTGRNGRNPGVSQIIQEIRQVCILEQSLSRM